MPLPLIAGAAARTVGQSLLQGAAEEVGGRVMDKLLGNDEKKEAPAEKSLGANQETPSDVQF